MAGGSGIDEVAAPASHAGQVKDGDVDANEKLASVSDEDDAILPKGQVDPVYEAKAIVLNRALFVVVGFGWASDNLWPVVTSLIFTPVKNEFKPDRPALLQLGMNLGLLVGAVFWGLGCDIFGRKLAFNLTLGATAVFGMAAAGAPNFLAITLFAALWSFGVGGNLPVDSAIFLEFLPTSHQYLLTVLSIYWAISQLLATLIAWMLLGNLTCEEGVECTREMNMGWRYFMVTIGGLTMVMFIIRFVFFRIHESPKYLMGKGNDEQAVAIVHEVARLNGKTSSLTLAHLQACEPEGYVHKSSALSAAQRRLVEKLGVSRIRALFKTKKLAWSTGLMMLVWGLIGLAFPLYASFLPYIQASRGADFGDGSTYLTYRNSAIIAVLGIPGALLGGVLVDVPWLDRKGTLSLATLFTGVFLYGSTTALNSNALLGWNCGYNFTSNIMYAVLYGFTPELFPTPERGTGSALTASSNRIFGVMAVSTSISPLVAMFANLQTAAPVYTSGALFIAAGVLVMLLPFESRGRAAL
ncbi:major facilitator superfamily domain-containing protein [Podospora aff. communis PSN243]|uniref:Major facilitator superfamily domain-containing protein n=1 Tax=Podospora aff. communis PSN243 TaxID=3040156 RepID=A0AAV9GVD4_9PEZI|nr:major facilitator superfamily domain-containing protein [Podospora aff. communis PSN243]